MSGAKRFTARSDGRLGDFTSPTSHWLLGPRALPIAHPLWSIFAKMTGAKILDKV